MSADPARLSLGTTIACLAALAVVGVAVAVGAAVLVVTAQELVGVYPEYEKLDGALVQAALVFGVCIEVVLVLAAVLVGAARIGALLHRSTGKVLDAQVVVLAAAAAVVVVVLPLVPGPPVVVAAVLGVLVVVVAAVLVAWTLRSVQRRAAAADQPGL